jgi:hypothetical protein
MTKHTSKLFRAAVVAAIGFMATGASINEAAAKEKSKAETAEDVGRTASSYRQPIHLTPSPLASKARHRVRPVPTRGSGRLQVQSVQ